jgi:2-phosphosulfolactate phosphatase
VRVRAEFAPGPLPRRAAPPRDWPRDPRTTTAVVIDVLRATTTLSVALDNGARAVIPVASPEAALAIRAREPGALLCGERQGLRIPGFDLGNSPAEYAAEVVANRTLIFASTNGSLALLAAAGCRRRLLAAFVNVAAVLRALAGERFVLLLCAGKEGRFAIEDAACAGMIAAALAARGASIEGGAARAALALAPRDATAVRTLVQGASHARTLRALHASFAGDVQRCATLDGIDRAIEI